MRTTKTLALSAAVLAAGLAAASAQVYSANVVGYINVTCTPGLSMIANQLDNGTNTVDDTFNLATLPPNVQLLTWNGSGFDFNTFYGDFGAGNSWDNDTQTTAPGTGFFFKNPYSTNIVVTFVGNVVQGSTTNPCVAGLTLLASVVPQAGQIDYDLGFTNLTANDQMLTWNGSGYNFNTYYGGGPTVGADNWDAAPSVTVGQSFFIKASQPVKWVRSFTVQ